ncbi:MAG: AMP-binding protein [Chloracidobacterium sp.]|uniref:AMP-binding protein n=1 Tax=Chloracidobacterium validum TaxID=2821543 RepID=A0ABX8B7S2_9BACT|nr:AMP-binding protein [Chloracidobacterium validum]QUW02958.1 AMP-binding protein [Chloracidobacterium validum]
MRDLLTDFEREEIVFERLDAWAHTSPDAVYFYYGEDDRALTFGEVADITDRIAGNLTRLGIGRGSRVSVLLHNPLVTTLAMFGIWKAGAVFCPINYTFTGKLLAYTLNDTQPDLLLTEPGIIPRLAEITAELARPPRAVVYDAPDTAHDHVPPSERVPLPSEFPALDWAELLAPAPRPDLTVRYTDPASIVYTSGTTGPSKGVILPFRCLNQYCFLARKLLTREDVIYCDLPMYHIAGAFALIARAAWVGCEVAVWNRFSPQEFWARIAKRGATTAILLDVMTPWLMKAPPRADDRATPLAKVHLQPLPLNHQEIARRFGFDIVTTGFGQTESGLGLCLVIEEMPEGEGTPPEHWKGATRAHIRQVAERFGVPVVAGAAVTTKGAMGHPMPFHEVAILDANGYPCAPGELGELCFRPKIPGLLFDGYLGKPEATLRAFRNLWFHTGDAAYVSADGEYFFVDRLGDRLRRRGENFSSYVVEDLLHQHPEIALCAVFPIPAVEGDEDDIVAFVVPKSDGALTEAQLLAWANEHLPKFMQPQYVRLVTELPRTLTNKVEKYKLRAAVLRELGRA